MPRIERQHHTLDATGQSVGRLATEIGRLLRGKHKPTWQPHIDAGDFVKVTNASHLKFTGKKLEQKVFYRHSGYRRGGLKETPLAKRQAEDPAWVVRQAVHGMLPNNKLRNQMLKRLEIQA